MGKSFHKIVAVAAVLMMLCSFSCYAQAAEIQGKDQTVEFLNKHYGPMLISFIQEGEMANIQSVSVVILDTGMKSWVKFSKGDLQGDRTIQARHFGGVWEMKLGADVTSLTSLDILKEENCLKPNIWGKKQ